MMRSRPFVLFILALCLVACVCANGKVSEEEAERIVSEAKAAAKKILKNAKGHLYDAEGYVKDANAHKGSAERAAAEAAEAAKGNQEAEVIVKKVKAASDEALKLYPEISVLAKASVDKMKPLVTKATKLDARATAIQIEPEDTDDYTKAKESAEAVKTEVDALDNEIKTASASLGTVATAEYKMSEFVKTARLAKYNVFVFIAVAKIETVLKSADDDIKLTEQKRDETNATEQEMKKLCDNNPNDSSLYFSKVHALLREDLKSASDAVAKAKQAKEDILKLKAQTDSALVRVEAEMDADKAFDEIEIVRRVVKKAEEKLKDTKSALETAKIDALSALSRKNSAERESNKRAKKTDALQDNDKKNSQDSANTHQPVQDTTESPTVIGPKQPRITYPDQSMTEQPVQDTTEGPAVVGTEKPTITNPDQSMTEQPVQDTTESSTVIGKKQLTITNPDQSMTEQTVRDTTESPTVIGKKQLTITNPDQSMTEQPVRDTTESSVVIGKKQPTITNPDQSMTEQPVRDTTESPTVIGKKQPTITNPDKAGSGGTEFTQPSSSDSAMTVSVPLLLTLIACAALY